MQQIYRKVIFIDDEAIQNHINSLVINKLFSRKKLDILSFTNPGEGFEYVSKIHCNEIESTILFLDLKMPGMSGWDFIEKLEKWGYRDTKCVTIYILTSSIDPQDIKKAADHPLVAGFLSKPLSAHLDKIMSDTLQAYSNIQISNA